MTRGQIIILVILIILWILGVFLAGFYGYKFHDEQKKNTTNEVLFIAGVVIAVGTFIGIIVVIIKGSHGKSKVKAEPEPMMDTAPAYPQVYASALPGNDQPYQPSSPINIPGRNPYMSYSPPLPPMMGSYQPSTYAY
jgi:hypothetical protein